MAILDDFEKHQDDILKRLRYSYPSIYVALVGRVLPRQIELIAPDPADYTDIEIAEMVTRARTALDRIEAGGGTLLELEAAIVGEP